MSVDPDDYLWDQAYEELGKQWADDHAEELLERHYDDAVGQFKEERLQAYFLANSAMASGPLSVMGLAHRLLKANQPEAALVFFVTAAEVTIKNLLVRPILSGLAHNDALADLMLELVPSQTGSDGFKKLLFGILSKVTSVDLAHHKRDDSNRSLWDEWKELRSQRNNLVHDGIRPPLESSALAREVAVHLVTLVFPKVLESVKLQLDEKYQIVKT